MTLESSLRATPPPIPESAKRKGPPPIPETARKKSGPPPIPETARKKAGGPPPIPDAARKAGVERSRQRLEAMEVQEKDVIEAFEINGFDGMEVTATLEKKDERKNDKENRNQDNIIADPETGLLGVLDGLGGEGQGDLASKAAERAIPEGYKQAAAHVGQMDSATVARHLVEQRVRKTGNPSAMKEATEAIEAMQSIDPLLAKKALALVGAYRFANDRVKETKGKTTASIGLIHEMKDGRRFALAANVGDSMVYIRRKNGSLEALTQEDSALNHLLNSGQITQEKLQEMKRAPDEKILGGKYSYKDLKRAMTASLGSSTFEPSLAYAEVGPDDEVILGTDGLVDKFEDPTTEETDYAELSAALRGTTATDQLNHLRQEAKKRVTYKKDDDIAIVRAKVKGRP